ncbi:MAG: DUF2304 domain-containing protein [Clostridiaceae bacterium]|nr:DUF2304 domain-containing protein [Clostridiaceae bacterium]
MGIYIALRILLIIMSVFTFAFVIKQIRKNKIEIGESLFWIIISIILIVISVFPQITGFFTKLLGIQSPSNFVFLVAIFIVMLKLFTLSIDVAKLKQKLKSLIENVALKEKELDEKIQQINEGNNK